MSEREKQLHAALVEACDLARELMTGIIKSGIADEDDLLPERKRLSKCRAIAEGREWKER